VKASTIKKEFWSQHIHQSEKHEGSLNSYCQSVGINPRTLQYWKLKFKSESRSASKKAFLPVVLKKPQELTQKSLPQAQWVAEFLYHFINKVG